MHRLAAAMTTLIPYVASDEKFEDPKNAAAIKAAVTDLAKETTSLKASLSAHGTQKSRNHDPLLASLATSFDDDVQTSLEVLGTGERSYAQHLLRNSVSYCTACHTRNESESKYQFPVFKSTLDGLGLYNRLQLLSAARQFNEALSDFEASIAPTGKTKPATSGAAEKSGPLEVERSSRLALSIAIRVENSEARALDLVSKIQKSKVISANFRKELESWKSALIATRTKDSGSKTPVQQLESARAMVDRAQKAAAATWSSGPEVSRVPDVEYLRASSMLHTFLEKPSTPLQEAEALYLLGRSYSELQSLGFWSPSDLYFESCVRKAPHTKIAQTCVQQYEDGVTLGYTGSSGVHVPAKIQANLKALRTLANPTTDPAKN